MLTSTIISVLISILSAWIVFATSRLMVRIVHDGDKHRLYAAVRSRLCDGFGRNGISLLCRDTADDGRLRNLLAVEYPAYEVIVVADSMRQPVSLQRAISHYRMVAVDGRIAGDRQTPRVRKMYRSASRSYRRLILLDVATRTEPSDLDAALDVATYDYILPLWNNEQLINGTVERLIAEVSTAPDAKSSVIESCIGASIKLVPREIVNQTESIASVKYTKHGHIVLHEPLAKREGYTSLASRVAVVAAIATTLLCAAAAMANIAPLAMAIAALSSLFVLASTHLATTVISRKHGTSVGYGDTLYLFCKNLLPRIWQIKK